MIKCIEHNFPKIWAIFTSTITISKEYLKYEYSRFLNKSKIIIS